jgi:hypothetical protein
MYLICIMGSAKFGEIALKLRCIFAFSVADETSWPKLSLAIFTSHTGSIGLKHSIETTTVQGIGSLLIV